MKTRNGQAMVELAAGMFAFALAVSALVAFASYIARALEVAKDARSDAGVAAVGAFSAGEVSRNDEFSLEEFPATYIFGDERIDIKEFVHIPGTRIFK